MEYRKETKLSQIASERMRIYVGEGSNVHVVYEEIILNKGCRVCVPSTIQRPKITLSNTKLDLILHGSANLDDSLTDGDVVPKIEIKNLVGWRIAR